MIKYLHIIILFFALMSGAYANVTVATATGGSSISADDEGGTYTPISFPVITEAAMGEIGAGTIILDAPTGFVFDAASAPTLLVTRVGGLGASSRNINDLATASTIAITSISTTQIIFTITAATTNSVTNSLTFQGVTVRPSTGAAGSGNLTIAGTSIVAGVTSGVTNFGTLIVVAGAFINMQVLVPGETSSPGIGSGKTGTPSAQTAGTSFNFTVNSVDAHWNIVSSTNTVTITSSDVNATLPADAALVAGTITMGISINTGGTGTVTASNLTTPGMTADTSPFITINAGAFTKLQLLMPGETADPGTASGKTGTPTAQTAGISFAVTVNAVDANWNLVTSETSTIAITSSDENATLPADAALSAGTNTYNVTFKTAGSETVTANDNPVVVTGNTSPSTTVNVGAFTKLQIIVPGETADPGSPTGKTGTPISQNLGTPFSVTVNAVDANWNIVTSTDVVDITCTDGTYTDPADAAMSGGTKNFSVTFNASGAFTVTATNVTDGGKTPNTSPSISAVLSILNVATGGNAISADDTGGAYTSLSGPVFIEGSSGEVSTGTIILNAPSDVIFDVGGTAPTLLMNRDAGAGADALNIDGLADGSTIALTSISTTQIEFTITTASSSGVSCKLTFQNVRVRPTTGAGESGNLTKTGTSVMAGVVNSTTNFGAMTVVAGAFAKMQLLVPGETAAPGTASGKTGTPSAQTAGTSFNVTVNAVDAYWNIVSSTNTVGITSSDVNATLPANAALVAGTKTMAVILNTVGSPTVTSTNITDGAKTADTSPTITLSAGAFTMLQILVPGETAAPGTPTGKTGTPIAQTAGTPFSITVNAVDASYNVISSTDVVGITASDVNVTLPANAALVAGTNNYGVTFNTGGTATITSTNITDGTKTTGVSPSITVTAGTFSKLQILVPGETADPGSATGKTGTPEDQSQGGAFTVTVNAVDANWNLISSETSNVTFSSSDVTPATLPGSTALVAGTVDVSVTFNAAAGTETVTAVHATEADNTSPAITIVLATLAPATGGSAISADDKVTPTYTALTDIVYTEGANGDCGTGTIIIEAPTGFIFNTAPATAPNLLVTRVVGGGAASRNINGLVSASTIALTSISTTQIVFTITSASNTGVTCSLTFQNIEVAPSSGEVISGNLTHTGTSVMSGINASKNFGTLTVVPGVFSHLQLLVPGETAAPGASPGKTGTASAQTAGTAFNVTVNAVDAYWNIVTGETSTVAITSSDVNATLPADAALVAGTNIYAVTLKSQGAKTITANDNPVVVSGDTSPSITVNGGEFTKMQILLPGETADPGSATGKTGTPTAQTAGISFNVTVNAVDANWNVVTAETDVIGITTTDVNATVPAIAALVAGTKDFVVTLKTVGSATMTSTNISDGTKTVNTSPSVTVNAGAYADVQILLPGETADPGSATGKTGTPSGQTPSTAFIITINAVDACWNVVSSTDQITITSSDGTATLPASTNMVAGTINLNLTLNGTGDFTATATNSTTTTESDISPSVSTNPVVWTGGASTTYWGDAANWNPSGVPGVNTNVDLTGANTIEIDVAAVCNNLTLNNANLSLSVLAGNTLSLTNDLIFTDGLFSTKEAFPSVGGTITITGGTVQFTGTAAQTFSTVSGTTFNDLTINNTSATGVTLSQPISVDGVFTLTDGNLFTDDTNILTMNAGSSTTGSSAVSFVDGPMNKAGTTAFVFPVGDGTRWGRIGIGAPTSSTTFKAEYFVGSPGGLSDMATSPTPVLNNVSAKEYWNLTREVGTGDAAVTLYWEDSDFSDIDDCSSSDLRVAHWNGSKWENNNNAVSTSGSCSSSAGSITTSAAVTDFSPFTFGSRGLIINPLPIELLSFGATASSSGVDLSWVTASEINNDYFTLERTIDGVHFEVVGTVDGAGNYNGVLDYSFVDDYSIEGVCYYRLKQTDFDGEYSYSELKMVRADQESGAGFSLYPNPSTGVSFTIEIVSTAIADVNVVVYDVLGKVMFAKTYTSVENSSGILEVSPSQSLVAGAYFVTITSNAMVVKKRLIVN